MVLRQPGVAAQTQPRDEHKSGPTAGATRSTALLAGVEISKALAASGDPADRQLSRRIGEFPLQADVGQAVRRHRAGKGVAPELRQLPAVQPDRRPEPGR